MTMRPLKSSSSVPPMQSLVAVVKPKACISCRTRKVKCDKGSPCSNCTLWSLECLYPSPIRRCPRSRKKKTTTLLDEGSGTEVSPSLDERILKVEQILKKLTDSIGGQQFAISAPNEVEAPNEAQKESTRDASRLEALEARMWKLAERDKSNQLLVKPLDDVGPGTSATYIGGFQPKFSHHQRMSIAWSGGVFLFNNFASETASLVPSPAQIQACWRTFLENVDQLAKVLHTPSAESILRRAVRNPTSLTKSEKALLFAICFSSVSSMADQDVENCFKTNKGTILMMYRSATEQTLSAADFLVTDDLITLQAFVLFISFSRYADDGKTVWALTGLARRLCSSSSELSPFKREMHKRLKWQLWYLDRRAVDDHGNDVCSLDPMKDWELPLNINDADLDPSMAGAPDDREGWTDMSFCLVRFDIANTSRMLEGDLSQHQKEIMINECAFKIQRTHLAYCDNKQPIHWLAQHVSYVMISEMWIKIFNDEWLSSSSSPRTQITRNQILLTAIDIVDTPRRLEAEPQSKRWKWLLTAYLQYHPLAFLLNELCQQQHSETLERAWNVAENAIKRWTPENKNSKNGEALLELMAKARAARAQTAEFRSLDTVSLPQEQPDSMTDVMAATTEFSYPTSEQMTDTVPFFFSERQFEKSPIMDDTADDMLALSCMTYTPDFAPESYNNFHLACNNDPHFGVLENNSAEIILGSEYQY